MIRSALLTLALVAAAPAFGQTRPPAEKLSPRPVQPVPKAAPAPKAAPTETANTPFVYSPWTKFCGRDNGNPQARSVCLTVKEARLDTGQFVAGAALIEPVGEDKKVLRVTLPLGMQLMPGVRMFIDNDAPRSGPYVICYPNGCMADFDVNVDFLARLKTGAQLRLQGINAPGQVASYLLPLGDFAVASDGPPTDPAAFERQQRERMERNRSAPK